MPLSAGPLSPGLWGAEDRALRGAVRDGPLCHVLCLPISQHFRCPVFGSLHTLLLLWVIGRPRYVETAENPKKLPSEGDFQGWRDLIYVSVATIGDRHLSQSSLDRMGTSETLPTGELVVDLYVGCDGARRRGDSFTGRGRGLRGARRRYP